MTFSSGKCGTVQPGPKKRPRAKLGVDDVPRCGARNRTPAGFSENNRRAADFARANEISSTHDRREPDKCTHRCPADPVPLGGGRGRPTSRPPNTGVRPGRQRPPGRFFEDAAIVRPPVAPSGAAAGLTLSLFPSTATSHTRHIFNLLPERPISKRNEFTEMSPDLYVASLLRPERSLFFGVDLSERRGAVGTLGSPTFPGDKTTLGAPGARSGRRLAGSWQQERGAPRRPDYRRAAGRTHPRRGEDAARRPSPTRTWRPVSPRGGVCPRADRGWSPHPRAAEGIHSTGIARRIFRRGRRKRPFASYCCERL